MTIPKSFSNKPIIYTVLICTSCKYDKKSCHCDFGKFIEAPLGLEYRDRQNWILQNPDGLGQVIQK